jgi:hypothetical protein
MKVAGVYPLQVQALGNAIPEDGEVFVSCDELRILCEDEVAETAQFNALTKIAIAEEEWSFSP